MTSSMLLSKDSVSEWARVDDLVAANYITARRHFSAPLTIYNYTPKAVFDGLWEPATIQCRGLIADDERNVVARPFCKFWNIGENGTQWLDEPYEVYDKVDGSLGIGYRTSEGWAVATRGSFHSEQAVQGTSILTTRYGATVQKLDPKLTYCWEIVYPENRIVVDYGDRRDLVLLAVFETASGHELALPDFSHLGFPLVERYPSMTLRDLETQRLVAGTNHEGFVVRFQSGQRVKVKMEEYNRLHRLVTQTTPRRIWEMLVAGDDPMTVARQCPPAYQEWVQSTTANLLTQYQAIESLCRADLARMPFAESSDAREQRKQNAAFITTCQYPSVLFCMLDGRDYSSMIWKLLYPASSTPFKVEV